MLAMRRLLTIWAFVAATGASAQAPDGKYLDGQGSKVAVILAHGPVIDVYVLDDRDARVAESRRALVSDRYQQVPVPGARHYYVGHEDVVAQAVRAWLVQQEAH